MTTLEQELECIQDDWGIQPEQDNIAKVILNIYISEYYNGTALLVYEGKDGKLYEVNGSHCS